MQLAERLSRVPTSAPLHWVRLNFRHEYEDDKAYDSQLDEADDEACLTSDVLEVISNHDTDNYKDSHNPTSNQALAPSHVQALMIVERDLWLNECNLVCAPSNRHHLIIPALSLTAHSSLFTWILSSRFPICHCTCLQTPLYHAPSQVTLRTPIHCSLTSNVSNISINMTPGLMMTALISGQKSSSTISLLLTPMAVPPSFHHSYSPCIGEVK